MKRNNLIFAVFAAIVAAAASCAKEQVETTDVAGGIPAGTPMTITAGVDSKIYYKGGNTICWVDGDRLQVFNKDNEGSTFITHSSTLKEAEFTCENWVGGTPVFAVHSSPASAGQCKYNGSKATAYLNPSQVIVHKNSFSKTAGLSVGTVSSLEGSYVVSEMKNVFGSIGFILSSSGVKSVTLTGNNDEDLAGWVDVDYNNGDPTWDVSEAGGKETSKSIVATVSGGGAVDKETDLTFVPDAKYYINVLPKTFTGGLTLTIEKQNGAKAVRKIESEIVLERNEKRSFSKALDNELPFDPLTIHFTASDGWPFEEEIVDSENQNKTGESGEIYTYKYKDGEEDKSCQFEIANPATPAGKEAAENKYYKSSTRAFLIRFNNPGTGSWIKLPAIEGRKLCSVKVANNNTTGTKSFHISTTPSKEGSLFNASILNSSATYFSSGLEYNKPYYIYISSGKNFQLSDLELIYDK